MAGRTLKFATSLFLICYFFSFLAVTIIFNTVICIREGTAGFGLTAAADVLGQSLPTARFLTVQPCRENEIDKMGLNKQTTTTKKIRDLSPLQHPGSSCRA